MRSGLVREDHQIKPFWLRVPSFFLYPMQPSVLLVMIGFSLLQLLSYFPGFGWIISLLLWVVLYKYSYEVLAHTADGHLDPPQSRYMAGTDSLAIKLFFLCAGMAIAVYGVMLFTGSLTLAGITAMFMLVALPAAIMVLAMSRALSAALNPLTWIAMMVRVGLPYFLVVFFLLLMLTGLWSLQAIIKPEDPLTVAIMRPVIYFIEFYFTVAMFHLMGYMIYQYHQELGVSVDSSTDSARPKEATTVSPLITETKQMVQDGKLAEAVKLLGDELHNRGGAPELHEHYRRLLHLKNDSPALLRHTELYLPILLELENNPQRAIDVVDECYRIDPKFVVARVAYVTMLADYAYSKQMYKLALHLTSGLAKRFPNHPDIPANYFLAAKILTDYMGEDKKALAILRSLIKNYPMNPLIGEIQQYSEALESIGAK